MTSARSTDWAAGVLTRVSGLRRDLAPTLVVLVLGWLAMFGPTYVALSTTIWASDEQGHGKMLQFMNASAVLKLGIMLSPASRLRAIVPAWNRPVERKIEATITRVQTH